MKTLTLLAACACALASESTMADMPLAVRGQPAAYTIVVPEKASPSQRYAAEELRDYTEKATGVKLPIATDAAPLPPKAILLGHTKYTEGLVGRVALNAPDSPDADQLSTTNDQPETNQGATIMTRKKAAAAALTAAMAAAPLAAANGDEYQFIVSGDPVAAATVGSSSARSDEITLETGALRVAGSADDLEARSRANGVSVAIALNATKFRTFIMTVR